MRPPDARYQWQTVGKRGKQNKNRTSGQYMKGTGSMNGVNNIAHEKSAKPQYLKHRVLVIGGLDDNINLAKLDEYINSRTIHKVNILHIACLDREGADRGATVAIELSDHDYDILSNSDFWLSNIRIKAWRGFRWWRSPEKPPKNDQVKNLPPRRQLAL